jgi:hypothetical protein
VTILEVLADLDSRLTAEHKKRLLSPELTTFEAHFGYGLFIRNRYLFRGGGTRILQEFHDLDLCCHEDGISALLVELYQAQLSGTQVTPGLLREKAGSHCISLLRDKPELEEKLLKLLGWPTAT